MSSEDFWFLARLWRRNRFENPVTEPKRNQKPKGPLSANLNSSLQLLWKCSNISYRGWIINCWIWRKRLIQATNLCRMILSRCGFTVDLVFSMNTRLIRIKNWSERAKETNWSVSKLASQCGVSRRSLDRYFNANLGKSPKKWLAENRQYCAISLLNAGYSIKEVAYRLGYKYPGNFSRTFRNHWGHSPTVQQSNVQLEMSQHDIRSLKMI
jgi:AraC-like DNA-binding protein